MENRINYFWPVTAEHSGVFHFFQTQTECLRAHLINARIVIFGAGIRGCTLLYVLQQKGYKNIVFCDNNKEKQGNLINCFDIFSLSDALSYVGPQVFLVSPENSQGIRDQLKQAGLKENQDWFSLDFPIYDAYVSEFLRFAEEPLLFMGDCAFSHVSIQDKKTASLGEMLKDKYGEQQCKVLAIHGIGHQANYHILHALIEKGEYPKALVLLTALEALAPKAHLMPRTQHPALLHQLIDVTAAPAKEFCDYAALADKRFHQFQVESFTAFHKEKNEVNEKLYMQMNYLFSVQEQSEGVVYLKKIIHYMNALNIPVILYIPPVNYQQGENFFGSLFKTKYEENYGFIFSALNKENLRYQILDASYVLNSNEFAASNTIDEGANYEGRKKLLQFISESEELQSVFKKGGEGL